MAAIQLVVGLGNPGERYAGTRHNVGFLAVERLAQECGAAWEDSPVGEGETARLDLAGTRILAAKPGTYMNASGTMVGALARYFKIAAEAVLVVSDDFSLPLGRIRVRPSGSAGGQKGLDSILTHLGTAQVPRVRLGIGPVPAGADPAAFVLGRFRPDEREAAGRLVERAAAAARGCVERGIPAAMNEYNAAEAA